MISLLLATSFLDSIKNIFLIGVIALVVIILIMILSRSEMGRNLITYMFCAVLICSGVICGINLYKEVTAESYINGSIDISNTTSQESFYYSASSLTFYYDYYDESEAQIFTIDLVPVEDFDGDKYNYQLVLNDYVIQDINVQINHGSVFAVIIMEFYNTDGLLVCNSNLSISIKFLSNKTTLSISVEDYQSASFFEQYFSDYGIRLKVLRII